MTETDTHKRMLLMPKEVGELLGVNIGTLARWRSQKTGPRFIKIHSRVRYRADDLQDWIDSRKGSSAA